VTKIRAIILDFDGVLVESQEAKLSAFENLFGIYPAYQNAMMDYHLANYSSSRMMKFEYYVYDLMQRPGDSRAVQAMADQFSEFVVQRVIACPEVPGAREFLDEFSHQVPLYVSSVTPESELRSIIHTRGIESFFVEVFGDPPWQKPDAIRSVLKRERLLPSEIIFVGDCASDYRTAVETGVEFVARNSGLPFNGVGLKRYNDLYEIANVIRERLTL
jgi:phosphoglycolate phosphatase-like HAD superfamily hydrolase